jgi:uncharacterized protein (TIGR00255 family)
MPSVASMTGFAREQGGDGQTTWTWELRSVNSRALDLRLRLPTGFDVLEPRLRTLLTRRCARGSFTASLTVVHAPGGSRIRINEEVLDQIVAALKSLEGRVPAAAPRLDGLLALRGVVETIEEEEAPEARAEREEAMAAGFERALDSLVAMRGREGAELARLGIGHLDGIADLTGRAASAAALQPEAIRSRLRGLIEELLGASPALPEERLAQEAALLVAKADAREELDRLGAHVAAARELLEQGGAVGRRLDFLCQELNREANTLCSKAADLELTRIGLAIKAAIEQLREQVQNIE